MQRLAAAFIYFLLVYACGFATGVVREFFITPSTGLTLALWIEVPVLLAASFFSARFVLRRFCIKNEWRERWTLGLLALVMLIFSEEMMNWMLRGVSVFTFWANFPALAAIANFAGILFFALMPVLIDRQSVRHQSRM
jgi:hypothetical protein